MARERRVSASRLGRLSALGRLVGGVAGGMVGEGARQLASGRRPNVGEMLLTPGNARRVAERLSEMRGAAMKVGQLLSMDSGELLPPQLGEVLARLREDAHPMPLGQVAEVLKRAWGEGWDGRFKRFVFTPIAAASIGQVHEALLKDGRRVAVKVQYPGVRQSIDSDVDNVAALLRLFRLLPEEIDVAPLLDEARRQLHVEADYLAEAQALGRFGALLAEDPRFVVPTVVSELTGSDVLTMDYLDGEPIERLAGQPAGIRDAAAVALTELALREVLDWGLVQTDPNFANFLFDSGRGRIQLLDFGATRDYAADRRLALRTVLHASLAGSDDDVATAAIAVGYLGESDPAGYRAGVVRLLRMVVEPAQQPQPYRFADSDLAQRMGEVVVEMRLRHRFGRLPPTDVLFLHRKLGGLYLLLTRIGARITVSDLLKPYLDAPAPTTATAARQIA